LEKPYITWICVVAVGTIAGVFVRPRWVAYTAGALLAACIVGLVLNELLGGGLGLGWFLRLAALAVTVLGAVAFAGAVVSHALVRRIRRKRPLEPAD
jgi:hypothetical protein